MITPVKEITSNTDLITTELCYNFAAMPCVLFHQSFTLTVGILTVTFCLIL